MEGRVGRWESEMDGAAGGKEERSKTSSASFHVSCKCSTPPHPKKVALRGRS